jgi:DNA invertase Pin-like site-specific DNA recombinase
VATRIGYSYTRYSSAEQGAGDSVARQTRLTAAWCKRHDVQLDTTRTFLDRGKSAYHGKHRENGAALAAFLREVERGDIPAGSVLIVENLDRLSRENPWRSLQLLCSLVNAGITVAALSPTEAIFEQESDLTKLFLATVEFGRGHSESKAKADRMSSLWAEKRRAVREKTRTILTRVTPGWIEIRNGKMVPIPERVTIIKRMFSLTLKGYGLSLVVRELDREKVPTWGNSQNGWSKRYIHKILSGRAVLGELQPIDGEPVPGYFPAVIDESIWVQAQAAMARRKHKHGPIGEKVAALFSGLLYQAVTGDRLRIGWRTQGSGQGLRAQRVLQSTRSMEGAARSLTFPSGVFEEAVLKLLKEVNPADVLGKEPEPESAAVAGELARKEQRARELQAELIGDEGDMSILARSARKLDEDIKRLKKRLAELRQKEANPRVNAWSEASSLFDVAKDEPSRLRLRELLRQIVTEIWVLVVPRRSHRFAVVQVFFEGDGWRDYVIHYQAKAFRRPGSWCARSLPKDLAARGWDLRCKSDAEDLTKLLNDYDIEKLLNYMRLQGNPAD